MRSKLSWSNWPTRSRIILRERPECSLLDYFIRYQFPVQFMPKSTGVKCRKCNVAAELLFLDGEFHAKCPSTGFVAKKPEHGFSASPGHAQEVAHKVARSLQDSFAKLGLTTSGTVTYPVSTSENCSFYIEG